MAGLFRRGQPKRNNGCMSNPLDSLELVGDVVADLGEGPCWDPVGGTLYWWTFPLGGCTGPFLPRVRPRPPSSARRCPSCCRQPGRGAHRPAQSPGRAGRGWYRAAVAQTAARPNIRFNDGGTDPQGRVWVGSMCTDEVSPLGTLYRLEHRGTLASVLAGVTISNGLGWSPDGGTMYYVDSPTKRIDVLDFTPATGQVSGRRPFADLASASGGPDGLTVDAEGGVWVAVNGSGVCTGTRRTAGWIRWSRCR